MGFECPLGCPLDTSTSMTKINLFLLPPIFFSPCASYKECGTNVHPATYARAGMTSFLPPLPSLSTLSITKSLLLLPHKCSWNLSPSVRSKCYESLRQGLCHLSPIVMASPLPPLSLHLASPQICSHQSSHYSHI